jgi:hypothetical protein
MAEIGYGVSDDPNYPAVSLPSMGGKPPPLQLTISPSIPDDLVLDGAPPELHQAIMGQESGNNPNSPPSVDGAVGQAQIEPATFKQYAKDGESINNPDDNLAVGKRIIDDHYSKYDGDPARTAVAYFSGPGNVAPADSPVPYKHDYKDGNGKSVSSYVADVQKRLASPLAATQPANAVPDDLVMDEQPTSPEIGVGKTAIDQGLQGATFGFADEAEAGLAAAALSGINGKSIKDNYEAAHKFAQDQLGQEMSENPGTAIAANLAGAIAGGVVGAGTKAGAAASNLLRNGLVPKAATVLGKTANTASKVALASGAGATTGGLYGAGTAEEGQRTEGAEGGAELGAVLGGAVPAVSGALQAGKGIVGLPAVNEALRPLAQKAMAMGIPLSRSQIGNSSLAKLMSSVTGSIPFTGADAFYRVQQTAFNRAISRILGHESDKIDEDLMKKVYASNGKLYNSALKGQKIVFTKDMAQSLKDIEDQLPLIDEDKRGAVQHQIDKIYNEYAANGGLLKGGFLKGETLGAIRSSVANNRNVASGGAKILLGKLHDAIMDMAGSHSAELRQANAQYHAIKTIEPLAIKAQATGGDISPALLKGAVTSNSNKRMLSTGAGGKLNDLANIGQAFMKEKIPDSGTAKRLMVYNALADIPAGVVALAHGFVPAAAAVAAPMVTAKGFQMMNNSQKAVARVLNNKAAKIGYGELKRHLAAGDIAGQIENQSN